MLSIPHMIVVFLVVLVVFGPHKLPELARGLGKLMAEFRKASTDFRNSFEEEMRDLERQAREVERRKAEAAAAAGGERLAAGEPPSETPAAPGTDSGWVAEVHEQAADGSSPAAPGGIGTVARTPESLLPATAAPEPASDHAEAPANEAEGGEPLHGQRQSV